MGKLTRLTGIVPVLFMACVAMSVPLTKPVRDAQQGVRGEPDPSAVDARGTHDVQGAGDRERPPAAGGEGTVEACPEPPGDPIPGLSASPEPSIYTEAFTRKIDRGELEARGARDLKTGLDAAAARAAVTYDNERWSVDQRRELLAWLRGHEVERGALFTDADAATVARLQAGSGDAVDGKLRDETMAVLFAAGFRFPARKAKAWEVKIELYPGELEDLDAWAREIEQKVTKNGGDYRDVDAPGGEGSLYVYVGGRIVAGYRGRGGPPSRLEDAGDHVAVPTKAGVYKLGAGHAHVTGNWQHSQIPWGAEIRWTEEGYQYRWPGFSGWQWATSHPANTLKKPFGTGDFEDLPEVTRGGETFWIWNKNDFGPLAWNLVASDIYVHTTPDTEADAARGAPTMLTHSHGCIHIDPGERDEMVERGYLQMDVLFVVRGYGEHLLPDRVRRDMLRGTGVASRS